MMESKTTKSLERNVAYQLRLQVFCSDGTFNSDNEYLTIINTAAVKRMDLLDTMIQDKTY